MQCALCVGIDWRAYSDQRKGGVGGGVGGRVREGGAPL